MASRIPKSSGSSSRSEAAGKGAKPSNQMEARSERAKGGNASTSKRSSSGGEKKSSASKGSK